MQCAYSGYVLIWCIMISLLLYILNVNCRQDTLIVDNQRQ